MKAHDMFKGLADPTRLRIVALLARRELCVCEIMEILRLPQSTTSRHMARLKLAGIVQDRRQGKWVHYSLSKGSHGQNGCFSDNIRRFLAKELVNDEPHRSDLRKLETYLVKERCP